MERDRGRSMRFDERRGGESYRPSGRISRSRSRSRIRRPRSRSRSRSRSRNRSPRMAADTWVPQSSRHSNRFRSRSPANLRRSRSPPYRQRQRIRSPPGHRSPRHERPRSPFRSSWRSRSPYAQQPPHDYHSSRFTTDASRAPYVPRSPRRDQPSPRDRYRDFPSSPRSTTNRERPPHGYAGGRSRSPYRKDQYSRSDPDQRRNTRSPVKQGPSDHPSAHNSASTSRRSSPPTTFERTSVTPLRPRSRSPVHSLSLSQIESKPVTKVQGSSSAIASPSHSVHDNVTNSSSNHMQERFMERPDRTVTNSVHNDRTRSPSHLSASVASTERHDQFKGSCFPDSRGSQQEAVKSTAPDAPSVSSAQNRASSISLLSAPTKPRGASNFYNREPAWSGRRIPSTPQAPPTGPRNRYPQSQPNPDLQRGSSYRHSNGLPATHQRNPRTNHLAALPTIVAGGRLLPSAFDFSIEKRLSHLESDAEKLMDQVMEKQSLKRLGLRDWDRLERESALNALKSDLAETHLQRMTEGEGLEGTTAF